MHSISLTAFAGLLLASGAAAQDAAATGKAVTPTVVTQNAGGHDLTIIFTDVATSPLSDVPGVAGAKFSSFDRPALSPNGMNWIISADTDLPSTEDDVLVVNGVVVLRENDSPSFVDPGDTINFFDQGLGITDTGEFCFANNTDDTSTEDDYIVKGDGLGGYTVIARESLQVAGAPMGWLNGFVNSAVITNSGVVGYETDSVDNTPGGATDDNLIMLGTTIVAQKGVTAPTGQLSGGTATWQDFDFEDFRVSGDGLHYILQGDLDTGATTDDDVVVVDGAVVIQEGFAIPGGPVDVVDSSGISSVFMAPSGDWMADGDFDVTNDGWVVYNGAIVATEGAPIHAGATEVFDSTFFANACNSVGDFIIGGSSDNTDTTRDAVIVLNNERVVCREGDPIDLDGNGVFDDDLFFNFFGTDDFKLTDDLKLYFVSTVRSSASTSSIGDVFVMLDLANGVGSPFCVAQPNSTGFPSHISGTGSPVASANSLTLDVCGLPVGTMGYFLTSLDTIFVPTPGGPGNVSEGDLCIGSPVLGRYNTSVLVAGAAGDVSLALDLTAVPTPTGPVAVMAGETRYWQYWHRDMSVTGAATSNFSNALCVTFQ